MALSRVSPARVRGEPRDRGKQGPASLASTDPERALRLRARRRAEPNPSPSLATPPFRAEYGPRVCQRHARSLCNVVRVINLGGRLPSTRYLWPLIISAI